MNHTVHHVRRALISIDPALAIVPMMGDVAGKYLNSPKPELKKIGQDIANEATALFASLDELGMLEPVKCYREGRKWIAADGRHRLVWADSKSQLRVPIIEISKAEAAAIIEASVIGRRHWTKGQRAWLGVMQHPEVCDNTRGRPENSDSVGITTVSLGQRLGVSADLVSQAAELFRKFYAPGAKAGSPAAIEAEACRGKYEHLIWGGAGLGAILAGIGGGDATGGKPKAPTGFQHLDAPLASLTRLSKHWMAWSAEERTKAQSLIAARIRGNDETPGWPSEFCLAIGEAMAAAGV